MSVWSDAVAALSPHAWYRHAEASGTTLTDSSGGGRNGVYTNTGDITYAQASLVPGGADNNSVLFAGAAFYNITSGLSFNRTNVTYVTTMDTTTTGVGTGGLFYVNANTRLSWTSAATTVRINATVVDLGYVPTPMVDGNPHLIVLVVATTSVQLWVDGTKVADVAHAATGGTQSTLRTNNLVGAFDETLLFTSNLSAAQIGNLWGAWQGIVAGSVSALGSASSDAVAVGINTVHGVLQGNATSSAMVVGSSAVSGSMLAEGKSDATGNGTTANIVTGVAAASASSDATMDGARIITGVILGNAVSDALVHGLGSVNTDTTNRVGGIALGGYGEATWEPPVADPADSFIGPVAHNVDKARAFTVPTMVGTRPAYAVAEISATATRPRIIVGGKDITYFRGVPTPEPGYRLIEPLDYGAGTLELPQISPAFERLGQGALKWLALGKVVRVQQVDTTTNEVVSDADYLGFIDGFSIRGNTLVCSLGGHVAGRAALMDRQSPLFRQTKDIGNWIFSAVTQCSRVNFMPRLGPVTGIEIASRGGTSMLDYMNELFALSVHQSGAEWTAGRRADGTWGMWLKDTTTIDATIYLDDARMVGDLNQSLAEQPNRIFVSCIAPSGRRISFGAFPGLEQGPPPPYPMDDESPFGEGATNADTDSGDGILVMNAQLVTMSYLSQDGEATYDAQATRAIKRLQDEAGLTQSGIMNLATWRALFDLSATGYSLVNSRILPAAQDSRVKKYNLTSSGAIAERNPGHDPHLPIVDRTINLGSGFTVQQARQYARDLLREASTPNWVGTITCHLSAILGEHNPGEPVTALLSAKNIRPGMNIWLPTFQGGTLVHVSGVQRPAGGGPPVLTVDTRARDTMGAWEAITRNRESRNNPGRAWLNNHRQSEMNKDHFFAWDDVSGLVNAQVRLTSGWNDPIQVVGGQGGTIQKIRTELEQSKTRYVLLVSVKPITAARLTAKNPQPLTTAGTAKWDKPAMRNWLLERGMVYLAGSADQPCGHFPGAQTGEDGELTGDPITGIWEDAAGVGYHTQDKPVLYATFWVLGDSRLPAGRIMWNQLEAGA